MTLNEMHRNVSLCKEDRTNIGPNLLRFPIDQERDVTPLLVVLLRGSLAKCLGFLIY